MIDDKDYQKFKKMCESNSNMERIPSLDLLEKSGCRLTDRHLITKDGMQYNPSIVNPEVMSDDMRKLFNSKNHIFRLI